MLSKLSLLKQLLQLLRKRSNEVIANLVRRKLLGVAILAVSILVATLIVMTGPEAEPRQRTEKAWPVSVVTANPDEKSPVLVTFGKVESRQVASLRTSITALVVDVVTPEGTWVNKGDLLVQLDEQEMRLALTVAAADYKKRIAQLQSAETEFDLAKKITRYYRELKKIADDKVIRNLDLYRNKMVSDAILDEARKQASERAITLERHLADLKMFPNVIEQNEASVAEGNVFVERAELDLRQTRIEAPFSGRVIRTYVAPGDRVLPGTSVIQVADYDGLEVRASIPADIGFTLRKKFQQGILISADGQLDGRLIHFVLVRLSGDVKSGQSGIDVFFKTSSDTALDIGRVVNLNITLPLEQNVVALPVQSIYENNRIYRVEHDRLKGIEVEQIGDYVDKAGKYQVLVRSMNISAGDKLVTTQLPRAITGLLVDAIDVSESTEVLVSKVSLPSD
jgi:multidrug efflux pump subunit AcrA (membrane-fusion protein)